LLRWIFYYLFTFVYFFGNLGVWIGYFYTTTTYFFTTTSTYFFATTYFLTSTYFLTTTSTYFSYLSLWIVVNFLCNFSYFIGNYGIWIYYNLTSTYFFTSSNFSISLFKWQIYFSTTGTTLLEQPTLHNTYLISSHDYSSFSYGLTWFYFSSPP